MFKDFKERVTTKFFKDKKVSDDVIIKKDRFYLIARYKDILSKKIGKRTRKFGLILITIMLVFVLGYSMIWNAAPGGLLFYPKQILEKLTYRSDDVGKQLEYKLKQFEDRLDSYIYLIGKSQCVKASIAEDELIAKTSEMLRMLPAAKMVKQSIDLYAKANLVLSETVVPETECPVHYFFDETEYIFAFAQTYIAELQSTETNLNFDILENLNTAKERLESQVEATTITDVELFNQLNFVLDVVNEFQTEISSSDNLELNPELISETIYVNELILAAQNRIAGNDITGIEKEVTNICMLIDNADGYACNPEVLNSTFNSFNQMDDLVIRFEKEQLLYNRLVNTLLYGGIVLEQ